MSLTVREDWLAQVQEDIIEPDRRIVDAHHHFFVEGGIFPPYDLDTLWADTKTHNVEQTVYMQCGEGYRQNGPDELACVGETEYVDQLAETTRQHPDRAQITGIIGTAELRLGARSREVLESHRDASDLFRGIRLIAAWDESDALISMPGLNDSHLYRDKKFLEGFAVLAEMGLVFDAYHYFHQTPDLARLARAFPEVEIVLDHFGTPLGVGPYADRRDEIYAQWAHDIKELASCPNVSIKLGGLVMPWCGFGFDDDITPPTSDDLVTQQAHYYHYSIEQFGPERCMFESNFPVDKCAVSYAVLWNAFKKISASYTEAEKDLLFRGTATRVYHLESGV
tara:strand:- start:933 stop:1946 length:1014 start_codon:yes stop_codon:yes gene_type:complete